uniref:PGG domain-containing protein n=2 Tax=Aegilops tauschii TaxID=37682 RepID=A0A453Q642_AEGTS
MSNAEHSHAEMAGAEREADAGVSHTRGNPKVRADPRAAAAAGAGAGDEDQIRKQILEQLLLHVQALRADGEPIQTPASQQAKEDAEYLDKMRGWLMTVATLFVGFAFQTGMHPPNWIPKDYLPLLVAAHTPYPDSKTKHHALLALRNAGHTIPLFMFLNTLTLAIGLGLLVKLLLMRKTPSRGEMKHVTAMVVVLAMTVACTFASGVSGSPLVDSLVFVFLAAYGVWTVFTVKGWLSNYGNCGLGRGDVSTPGD